MSLRVDLNSDMGEGFGPWRMGDDAALLGVVSSANIACGFHAGDPDVMAATMTQAVANGVGLGAHPGFADLQGFGRRRLALSEASLANMVRYQLGAAQAMAAGAGGALRHVKLHGALSNIASEDIAVARACYRAAAELDPALIMLVLAGTAQEAAVRELGCPWAGEIFADRAYNADATLVDRSLPGAMIEDVETATARILTMLREGAIVTATGARVPAAIDSICVHGDSDHAVAMAQGLRARLTEAGVTIAPFEGRR